MNHDIVASIYEAGAFPERWLDLLDKIAESIGAIGGNLIRSTGQQVSILSSPAVAEVSREFEEQGWNRDNSRVRRCLARASHPGFLTDRDLHTAEEMRRIPMYAEFLTPRGLDAGAGTVIQGAQDEAILIAFEAFASHDAAASAVPTLDAYRPHLARAAALSSQIADACAATLVNVFSSLGSSVALLGVRGRVVAATDLFAKAFDDLLLDGGDRLRLVDPRGDQRFVAALHELEALGQGTSIAVRNAQGQGRAILHLIPAARDAKDLFGNVWSFAVLAKPENRLLPDADIIGALFDLTPAEARVARMMAEGKKPAVVAREFNVSVETVRAQLKRIFFKTSSASQAELVSLLTRLGQ